MTKGPDGAAMQRAAVIDIGSNSIRYMEAVRTGHGLRFSKNPAVNRRVSLASTRDLPFKNVRLNVGAALGEGGVQALLRLLNGHTNKDK